MDDLLVDRILTAVECVPPGSVVTYGEVAELVETSARHVGNVMARFGHDVPWWRVTRADGRLADHLLDEARARWRAEGVPLAADGAGCELRRCRANLVGLGRRYATRSADLPVD